MLIWFERHISEKTLPLYLLTRQNLPDWLVEQSLQVKHWVKAMTFTANAGELCLLSDESGAYSGALVGIKTEQDVWELGDLPFKLPEGSYRIATELTSFVAQQALTAWGLGAYQFSRYRKAKREPARLVVPKNCHIDLVENTVNSIYLVRDLINTPAEDMGPLELAEVVVEVGKHYHAEVTQVVGEDLLDEMYPAIFTVGRASYTAPRLIDLQWGDHAAPKLTLIGKGVCFDTGGLNLKPANNMILMKKDMGGAAHVLGLAKMIMQANLPICLRVLIPAVENSICSDAYRPGDIITFRNGKTVEITDTDAEGRLILADALIEACADKPDLLIDFATLTGAARVAVGTEMAAMFSNDNDLTQSVMAFAAQNSDPIWPMPLHQNYTKLLESPIADMVNCPTTAYAGAITAALFLQAFVDPEIPWLHFDVMAWNVVSRPGHPQGGEAMGIRALFDYLRQRFSPQH